ncbi:MAG: glycerate kinase [Gemmatimonadota bacterium]
MILVAPTAFKGTLSARAAAEAMAAGARAAAAHHVVIAPLSDGGPGLIDALEGDSDRIETVRVSGPLGARVNARVLWRGAQAVVESADACGLHLVPQAQRDPWRATTRGVGELISFAAANAREIVIGLGGSATVDGGIGMAAALGWRLLDAKGEPITPVAAELHRIARIEPPAQQLSAAITVLADVVTPLVGAQGAARVFGPQKGVVTGQIDRLDRALEQLADVIARDLGTSVHALPAGGAAGGLGAGLVAFLNAAIQSGSDWVLQRIGFDDLLARASLLVTGEGSYDAQSSLGKITGVVIERAAARGVPVLLIAGRVEGLLPAHVQTMDHAGRRLSATDLERMVRASCARLLPS